MTVSRVMNGSASVADATRRRVEQVARELGYAPNSLARGLVNRSSQVIGVVASDITNPFIAEVVRAIHRVADEERFMVTLCVTDYDVEREVRALQLLVQQRIAGLIVTQPSHPRGDEAIYAMVERRLPIVAVSRALDHPRIHLVSGDTRQGSYQAMQHLLDLGHRRIACITGSRRVGFGGGKFDGYRDALAERGIAFSSDLVVESDHGVRDGYLAMQRLLQRDPLPTAVLAPTDPVAIGAMGAIEASGRVIPDDIAVIGFDDIPYAASVHPSLTTVHQPIDDLGRLAARILFDAIRVGVDQEASRTVLPCALVIRESTIPLRALAGSSGSSVARSPNDETNPVANP